ncbi:hypothetical protein ATANTOWER_032827 [Ataeniobius toweri]|uniref:Uncharacterized protein n=1 Tax=Ataeniobius toweri TaxID=208326 RepID=A0ABU7CH02_9TELE|nr:hypothetical protein [Ataeniobius toweri]
MRCSKLAICFMTLPRFKLLHSFFSDLSAVFLGLHVAVCSLMFSTKTLRLSQNNWNYTEIKLHTCRLNLLFRGLLVFFFAALEAFIFFFILQERGQREGDTFSKGHQARDSNPGWPH